MRHLLTILAALLLCSAPLHAQTMKSLMFNSTNGQVVANTGTNSLRFTNDVSFYSNLFINSSGMFWSNISNGISIENQEIYANGQSVLSWGTNSVEIFHQLTFGSTNAATVTRTNLGLGWPALTNTNAATSLLGFTTNGQVVANTGTNALTFTNQGMVFESSITFEDDITANAFDASIGTNSVRVQHDQIVFAGTSADVTRTNLSLGLPALTNTSNVTAMRALSGSTNTNHPYSGSISVVGTNNTNTLVFSNGILQSVQ